MIYAYIRLADMAFPLYEGDIRLEHPEIVESQTGDTFPCPSTYAPVIELPIPDFNSENQDATITSAEFIDGQWFTKWEVTTFSAEQIQQRQIELEEWKRKNLHYGEETTQVDTNTDSSGSPPNVIG
jgi:hypothetical protein